jgi:hypothetical protein
MNAGGVSAPLRYLHDVVLNHSETLCDRVGYSDILSILESVIRRWWFTSDYSNNKFTFTSPKSKKMNDSYSNITNITSIHCAL